MTEYSKETLGKIKQGLQDSKEGRLVDRGSFLQHLTLEDGLESLFGDKSASWLNSYNIDLKDTPSRLLKSPEGQEQVRQYVFRMCGWI